ncbi:MAG: ABC transporter permease [Anaerolineae bacterium]|nr:ABC transporter permease [Anaerolineae bacterium]
MTSITPPSPPALSLPKRLSRYFFQHPRVMLLLLLALPLGWLLIFYLGSLLALLAQSFQYWRIDDNTGAIIKETSLATYSDLLTPSNLSIIGRTVLMAASVTVASALIGFPLAYFMARYASPRMRSLLYLGVLLPLWSNYLVRVNSWKLILADEGVLNWLFRSVGLGGVIDWLLSLPVIGGSSLSFSFLGMFLVFVYIWIPYMILPINAALERVPRSLIEASSDLGARPGYTFRKIILPLAFPGVVAGSIFTFSLTLGDFIIPNIIGNGGFFIGSTVLTLQGTTGNIPLAAAFAIVPIVIMGVYLLIARRLGAFDAL